MHSTDRSNGLAGPVVGPLIRALLASSSTPLRLQTALVFCQTRESKSAGSGALMVSWDYVSWSHVPMVSWSNSSMPHGDSHGGGHGDGHGLMGSRSHDLMVS